LSKLSKTQLEKSIHCGQLMLRKISKIGATRCHILRLKCTKFDFRWGSTLDPAGGAYSAPLDPLAVSKGPTSKGWEVNGEGKGRGSKRKGKGREGGEGDGNMHAFGFSKVGACDGRQQLL